MLEKSSIHLKDDPGHFQYSLLLLCLFYFGSGCGSADQPSVSAFAVAVPDSTTQGPALSLLRSGKLIGFPPQETLFEEWPVDSLDFPIIDGRLLAALADQEELLRRRIARHSRRVGNLTVHRHQLQETVRILQYWQHTRPLHIGDELTAHRIWGEDQRGNVRFTGYFTPIVKVNKDSTATYRYPIYTRPLDWEGPLPTRAEIEGKGLLAGRGLELAYAENKVEIYYMQVQGSGYVQYPDGTQDLFAYYGTNRHPYHSIEKYLMSREDMDIQNLSIAGIKDFLIENPVWTDTVLFQNPSYSFFTPKKHGPFGAGTVPLHAGISVAADRNYLPLGSCLLAAVPIYDARRHRVTGHEFRILLTQDVGGAIRGAGHLDLYFGTGPDARRKASLFKHYGQVWLLLPKGLPAVFTSSN